MTNKEPFPHSGKNKISSEADDKFAVQHEHELASKQKNYNQEDKRKGVRQEHTNGSTSYDRM